MFDASRETFFDPAVYLLEVRRSACSLIAGTIQLAPVIFLAVIFLA